MPRKATTFFTFFAARRFAPGKRGSAGWVRRRCGGRSGNWFSGKPVRKIISVRPARACQPAPGAQRGCFAPGSVNFCLPGAGRGRFAPGKRDSAGWVRGRCGGRSGNWFSGKPARKIISVRPARACQPAPGAGVAAAKEGVPTKGQGAGGRAFCSPDGSSPVPVGYRTLLSQYQQR